MKLILSSLALFAGIAIAVQAAVNSQLRMRLYDPMHATLVSFGVGTLVAMAYCLLVRSPLPTSTALAESPWWIWTGGLLGIVFVWSSVVVGPKLGVAMLLSLVIAGQMVTSLLIDHYGWFQMDVVRASPYRTLGVMLVVIGATIVSWMK